MKEYKERVSLSIYHTHTLSLGCMNERELVLSSERDREAVEIIFMFSGFTAAISAHSISEEVARFSPLWFPRGKLFMSLISCDYFCACYSLR